jgi:hypothetical protein
MTEQNLKSNVIASEMKQSSFGVAMLTFDF